MTVTRRRFVRNVALGGVAAGVGLGFSGWRGGGVAPVVDTHTLRLPDLPNGFEGFKILLISDVHAGARMDESRMSSVVAFLNTLDADLVLMAGDMMHGTASANDMRSFARAFHDLKAVHGTLAVPGNHDQYAGIDAVSRELSAAGVSLLRGGHRTIERPGGAVVVLGVDDPGVEIFDPPQDRAVAAVSERSPRGLLPILVAHRPAAFDAAARYRIPLTLAGHTHGGQVGLPWRNMTPTRLYTRYVRGHYQRNDSHLVVSSGIGTGSMPIRLGIPPSVALITLRGPEAPTAGLHA